MRKIGLFLTIIVMLLSICACSKNGNDTGFLNGENGKADAPIGSGIRPGDDSNSDDKNEPVNNTVSGDKTESENNSVVDDKTESGEKNEADDKIETGDKTEPDDKTETGSNNETGDKEQTGDKTETDKNESGEPVNPDPNFDPTKYTYQDYLDMTGKEQEAFFDKFESTEAFFDWLNAAKEKADKENPDKEVGADGSIVVE